MSETVELTSYQKRLYNKYYDILEVTGLNLDRFLSNPDGVDKDSIVPIINSMIDQAVRSSVIVQYTFIDMQLDLAINKHFFGTGKIYKKAQRTKRFKTMKKMLEKIYLTNKLQIVESFMDVPREISSNIKAINDLRNGLAHSFFYEDLVTVKRTYKRKKLTTVDSMEGFLKDTSAITNFFLGI